MLLNTLIHSLFIGQTNCHSSQLEVKQSNIHGRGVFSTTVFKPGQLIEKAPVILMTDEEKIQIQHSSLHHYYFLVNNPVHPISMGFGYSSLYNHASVANACYSIDISRLTISIKASKKIERGEEITINYNGHPNDPDTVCFAENN